MIGYRKPSKQYYYFIMSTSLVPVAVDRGDEKQWNRGNGRSGRNSCNNVIFI